MNLEPTRDSPEQHSIYEVQTDEHFLLSKVDLHMLQTRIPVNITIYEKHGNSFQKDHRIPLTFGTNRALSTLRKAASTTPGDKRPFSKYALNLVSKRIVLLNSCQESNLTSPLCSLKKLNRIQSK